MSFLSGAHSDGRAGKSIRYPLSGKMPSAKITKYNPGKDIVAGRTASQIESAKRKAVGGKRKRCTKGKSCSATCIAANKVCLVEIPWVVAKGIPKVVVKVNKVQEKKTPPDSLSEVKKIAQDVYKKEWSKAWKNMNLAINDGDKQKYNFWKEQISKYHSKLTAKGVDIGPLKIPTWKDKTAPVTVTKPVKPGTKLTSKNVDSQGRPLAYKPLEELPGFVNAQGSKPTLPSLKTTEDFKETKRETGYSTDSNHPYWKTDAIHVKSGNLLIVSGDLTPEQKEIADKMGGEGNFKEAVRNIMNFTGSYYSEMRDAQRKKNEGKELSQYEEDYLNKANSAEKLLSLLPKERLIKFRGAPVSDEKLSAIIEASKDKGEHAEGALASWSTSLEKAQNFADKKPHLNQVIYRTVNTKGASVRSVSFYKSEEEILTPGSARYRHTGNYEAIKVDGRTYHVFDIEELESV